MALKAETGNVTLNVELGSDDGSGCQNEKVAMSAKLRMNNGSKRQTENGSRY